MTSRQADVDHGGPPVGTNLDHAPACKQNQQILVKRIYVLDDDAVSEYDLQQNEETVFQFAPAHRQPSRRCKTPSNEGSSRYMHPLDSDDDHSEASHPGFQSRRSNSGLSQSIADLASCGESTGHAGHRSRPAVVIDHVTGDRINSQYTEQKDHLSPDIIYDESEEQSPNAISLAGTTQVDHNTPASHAGPSAPATAVAGRGGHQPYRPGSAPPQMNHSSRANSEFSSTPRRSSVLKPRNNANKITKPAARSVRRSPSPSLKNGLVNSPATDHEENVEEALIYLIGRNRRRAESEKQLQQTCHTLEAEKQALQHLNDSQQRELASVQQQWQITVQDHHIRDAEVQDLKSRYERVKKTVQVFAQTSEDLKAGRNKLLQELTALKLLNSTAVKNSKEAVQRSATASDHLAKAKDEITALRVDYNKLKSVETELNQTKQILRDEKLTNKKLELYVQRLEGTQRLWHARSDAQQIEIVSSLSSLIETMKDTNTRQRLEEYIQPVLISLDEIQKSIEKLPLAEKYEALVSTGTSRYEEVKAALKDVQGSVNDQHAAADLQFSNIISSLADIEPDLAQLQRLEADNATLLQDILHKGEANSVLRKSQASSQLMSTGLLENQKQLLSQVKLSENTGKTIQDLIESKMEVTKLLDSKQQENDELKATLKQANQDLANTRQEMVSLQEQSCLKSDQMETNHKKEIAKGHDDAKKKEQEFNQNMEKERRLYEEQKRKLKDEAGRKFQGYEEKVKSLETQIGGQNSRSARQEEHITKLEQERQTMQESIEKLRNLEQEKEAVVKGKENLKADLQISTNEVQRLRKDLIASQDESSKLKQEIRAYRENLAAIVAEKEGTKEEGRQKASQYAEQLSALNGTIASAMQANTRLQNEISKLEQEAIDGGDRAKQELKRSTEKFKKELEAQIKDAHQQISEALKREEAQRKESLNLDAKLKSAQKEKSETNEKLTEVQTYTNTLSKKFNEQVEKIKRLEQENTNLKNIDIDLERAKTALVDKEAEAAQHSARSKNLEEELLRFAPMREYITDEELAELTEPIILSLKSQIHASQSQKEKGQIGLPTRNVTKDQQSTKSHRETVRKQTSQGRVIPDSQSQGALARRTSTSGRARSPDLIDYSLDLLPDNDSSTAALGTYLQREAGIAQSQREAFRPGTGNDEMLLRSPDSPEVLLQSPHEPVVQIPASSYSLSPMKTRNGSRIRHVIAETQTGPPRQRASTPSSQQKDNHTPNSAAKRQNSGDESGSSFKKPRLQQIDLQETDGRSSSTIVTPKQTRFADRTTVHPASDATPNSAGIAATAAPAPGSMRKRTNASTRSSKNSAYGDRFH